jgi:hypothetical protein
MTRTQKRRLADMTTFIGERFYLLRYAHSWMVWDRMTKKPASGYFRDYDRAAARAAKLNAPGRWEY